MSMSERSPGYEDDGRAASSSGSPIQLSAPRHGGAGSRRRTAVLMVVIVMVAMAVSGGAVFWWQHQQARDRSAALATAHQETDLARGQAAGLRTEVQTLTGKVDELDRTVDTMRAQADRLRSRVKELQGQLAAPTAACTSAAILPVIQAEMGSTFGSISIQECQNGYAHLSALVADPQPGMESGEQVFMKAVGEDWQILVTGTGTDCQPPFLPPELETACTALGLT